MKMTIDNNFLLGSVELSTIRTILSVQKMQIIKCFFISALLEELQAITHLMSDYSS